MSLQESVRYIKGVGPKRARALGTLGIDTVKDLLDYVPFRIDDFSQVKKLNTLRSGDQVTVEGKVVSVAAIPGRRGPVLRVGLFDGTGDCFLVWYNMPYLARSFYRGMAIVASGKVQWRRESWEMAHPLWEEAKDPLSSGLIVPVYHGKSEMPSSRISNIVNEALKSHGDLIPEILPEDIVRKRELLSQEQAYKNIHNPVNSEMWYKARRTLAFREVFLLQLALLLMKDENENSGPTAVFTQYGLPCAFTSNLPFELTRAQKRTIQDIHRSLSSGKVMNRLIQGDVGSGKTVVAIWALLAAVDNGYQGAFLAPTEVLARQHKRTVENLAGNFAQIGFLSGSMRAGEKREAIESIAEGSVDILVGTHAMLEPQVKWANLGLVVTDEQHRFGVKQRLNLSYDTYVPHVLVMSATPIPRSLALTIYGDLDISVIDEFPHGRKQVNTQVLEYRDRGIAYGTLRKEVEAGRQGYVVCPLIREGKSGRKAAEQVFEELKKGYLRGISMGLAHGDMPRDRLVQEMNSFAEGHTQVLVATTVIEVGVDVRNASCIIIEGAESFGLAALHQLRGRVGRKGQDSYCYLIPSKGETGSLSRIKALESLFDGFEVAEADLVQRGPGQFFGVKQHGIGDINMEDLAITGDIIFEARQEARSVMEILGSDQCIPWKLELLIGQVKNRFGNLARHARSR
ncbi:MAG: ATP-dependent DNA helicase RecG [Bacillota bacterium]|jgi:ATP-dependent DNA helicase RecG